MRMDLEASYMTIPAVSLLFIVVIVIGLRSRERDRRVPDHRIGVQSAKSILVHAHRNIAHLDTPPCTL